MSPIPARLEVGRQTQIDAGGAALVTFGGRLRLERFDGRGRLRGAAVGGRRPHEVGVQPAQPYVDRARGELAGDLAHRGGEHMTDRRERLRSGDDSGERDQQYCHERVTLPASAPQIGRVSGRSASGPIARC
ncbi:hypothetical protein [Streptomyces hirsutus]|uniref:hypothetical protein n=1 Tax=Streptomyces hirsutus TaxID=35620 RepID=UPI0006E35E51|nr:hypothetical protein [Streptomyces hirsutus]